uniref:Uncharacterized protein n=1 Tax=Knipowitschia caucasica TaxID=637954 RepID=A0AAV2LHQ3_KNICA
MIAVSSPGVARGALCTCRLSSPSHRGSDSQDAFGQLPTDAVPFSPPLSPLQGEASGPRARRAVAGERGLSIGGSGGDGWDACSRGTGPLTRARLVHLLTTDHCCLWRRGLDLVLALSSIEAQGDRHFF